MYAAARGGALTVSEATPKCCLWCRQPLTPRRGGSPKRFCCAEHRLMFWHAARQWAERAITAGILTIGDLKKGAPEACTLLLMGSGTSDGPEEHLSHNAYVRGDPRALATPQRRPGAS